MKYFKIICWTECPYCIKAKSLLISKSLPFEYCSVDHSPELLEHFKTIYNHETVPMVLVREGEMNEQFIGGFTELVEFFKQERT